MTAWFDCNRGYRNILRTPFYSGIPGKRNCEDIKKGIEAVATRKVKSIKFIPDFKLSKLKRYENNPKKNNKTIEALGLSLNRFGAIAPIICNEKFVICDGHARYDAAIEKGDKTFPVIIASQLVGDDFKAYNIAATQTARLAEWDEPILAEIIRSLSDSGYEIDSLGFDGNELEDIMNSLDDNSGTAGLTDPDEVPEPPKKPITKPGDLWQLGKHRLLCGDATKAEDVERLMDGEVFETMFTSPPYNAGDNTLGGNNKMKKSKYRNSDDIYKSGEWLSLLNSTIINHRPFTKIQVLNLQQLSANKIELVEFLYENRYNLIDVSIWFKGGGQPAMAESVMNSRFEYIFIFSSKKNPSRKIEITKFRNISNVFELNPSGKNKNSDIHAATFPVEFAIHYLSFLSNKKVTDPFVGSGTTIIACEQTGRTCYAMDIDPIYCDVSIKRWENFTGQKAKRI